MTDALVSILLILEIAGLLVTIGGLFWINRRVSHGADAAKEAASLVSATKEAFERQLKAIEDRLDRFDKEEDDA